MAAAAAIRTQSPTHRVGNNHPGCCSSCCFASTQISLSPPIPSLSVLHPCCVFVRSSPVSTHCCHPAAQWCSSFRLLLGLFFLAPSCRLLRLVVCCSSPRRSKPHIDPPFFDAQSEKRVYIADGCGCHPFRWGAKVLGSFISAPGSRFRGIRLTPWTPAKALMTGTAR
jgi:hypothetical protein